jgi:hypothetical protein
MVHRCVTAGQGLVIVVSGDCEAPLECRLRTHADDDPGEVLDVSSGVIGDLRSANASLILFRQRIA